MKNANIDSEIVYIDGEILEQYGNTDDIVPLNSITKSITAMLVGTAIQKGLIDSVDDSASKYIKGYDIDSRISIKSLLSMSPGIDWEESILGDKEDWIQLIAERPVIEEQIGCFKYGTASSHLLGKIVADVSGMSLEDFAVENLFKPLGIEFSKEENPLDYYIDETLFNSRRQWDMAPEGNNIGSFSLRLSAGDLLKLGKLILNGGKIDIYREETQEKNGAENTDKNVDENIVNELEIIPKKYIIEMVSPLVKAEGYGYYGYQGWIKKIKGYTVYSMIGIDDKYMSVIPELNTIFILLSKVKKEKKVPLLANAYIRGLMNTISKAEKNLLKR